MAKFIANQENKDRGFATVIREIESTDSSGRRLSTDMYNLGAFLHENKAFNPVQIFNWLSDTNYKTHEKDGLKYIEILPNDKTIKIMEAFKQWFLDAGGFGFLAMKHFNAKGIFIRNNGRTVWQYPAYSRRADVPFDVQSVIRKASESIAWR